MHFCMDEVMMMMGAIPVARALVPRLKAKVRSWRAKRHSHEAVDILMRVANHTEVVHAHGCTSCENISESARTLVDTIDKPHPEHS